MKPPCISSSSAVVLLVIVGITSFIVVRVLASHFTLFRAQVGYLHFLVLGTDVVLPCATNPGRADGFGCMVQCDHHIVF